MENFGYQKLLFAALLLCLPLKVSADITFVFTEADWEAEINNAGLAETLETFDTFADGPLPSFAVAGVEFNLPSGTVSGGALTQDFRVGSDYSQGTIDGQPIFGIAFSSPGVDTLSGQAFDVNGLNTNTGDSNRDFFGIISTAPLRSIQLAAAGTNVGSNPNALMDNFRIATMPFATGSISFVPQGVAAPLAVPTLTGLLVLAMALLLGWIGMRTVHQRKQNHLVSILGGSLVLACIVAAAGGVYVSSKAFAGDPVFVINDPAGETFDIAFNAENVYENQSGVSMIVSSIRLPTPLPDACPSPFFTINISACELDSVLPAGQSCAIDCTRPAVSDTRLKADIERIGQTPDGLPLYHFRYIGDSQLYRGVMAQDVLQYMPEAVVEREDGYLMVDYRMLGLSMDRVD